MNIVGMYYVYCSLCIVHILFIYSSIIVSITFMHREQHNTFYYGYSHRGTGRKTQGVDQKHWVALWQKKFYFPYMILRWWNDL